MRSINLLGTAIHYCALVLELLTSLSKLDTKSSTLSHLKPAERLEWRERLPTKRKSWGIFMFEETKLKHQWPVFLCLFLSVEYKKIMTFGSLVRNQYLYPYQNTPHPTWKGEKTIAKHTFCLKISLNIFCLKKPQAKPPSQKPPWVDRTWKKEFHRGERLRALHAQGRHRDLLGNHRSTALQEGTPRWAWSPRAPRKWWNVWSFLFVCLGGWDWGRFIGGFSLEMGLV